MSLGEWSGWNAHPESRPLTPVHPEDWPELHATALARARADARNHRTELVNLVRAVLDDHHGCLTLLGTHRPLSLFLAARDLLDPVLSVPGHPHPWTYSTYEQSDTTPEASPALDGAPRFWRLRVLPRSGVTTRSRLELDRPTPADRRSRRVTELVNQYLADPDEYLVDLAHRLTDLRDIPTRILTALEPDPHHPDSDPYPPPATIQPTAAPPPPAALPPVAALSSPAATPNPALTPAPNPAQQQPAAARPPVQSPRPSRRRARIPTDDLLQRLQVNDLSVSDHRKLVAELTRRWSEDDPYLADARRWLEGFQRRLRLHERVLLGAVALCLLTAALTWLFWPTASPAQPVVVTVTVTQPAPPAPAAPTTTARQQ
jgi:hypothetical protein